MDKVAGVGNRLLVSMRRFFQGKALLMDAF